ncbi:MAG: PD40 domain-containing protein [Acidobacteria bacterium]|nr:PD40 domain-containing protein [Acidobacteriota bacterium]
MKLSEFLHTSFASISPMCSAARSALGVLLTLSLALMSLAVRDSASDQAEESGDTSGPVTSVVQITHDGIAKSSLLSDDSFLYVTEWPQAGQVVAKVSLQNATRTLLSSTVPNIQALDISRDRTQLLVSSLKTGSSQNQLWTVPLAYGSPRRVGDLRSRDASWSSDGRLLAFAQGSTLYIAPGDGNSARGLLTLPGSVFAPRISPDGKRIRFTVADTAHNTTSIWEIASDGSSPHALFPHWQKASRACCGIWTTDGRYYIFQVTESGPTTLTTLWAMADRGPRVSAAPMQLTGGPISFGSATPAQDGKNIWAIGVQPAAEVVNYHPRRGRFVSLLSGVSSTELDFSRDARWVTYVAVPEGTLWRSKADGSGWLKLTSSPERAALPHWSPDGSKIAYVSMQPGRPSRIAVIPSSGGPPEAVLPESRNQIDANWSPDGNRVMFGYTRDADGINIRMVDLRSRTVEAVPGSEGLFSPRWSPNGRYIAALSPDFTNVMLFDFGAKKWTKWLTEPARAVSYPVWSADSRYLYFDDPVTGDESIRRVKVGENRVEGVFKLEAIERYPGPFGLWFGRSSDGSFTFIRDRSTQEVYQLRLDLP